MTIKSLLDIGEDKDIALTAPARPSMSYAQLRAHIKAIGGQLAGKGLAAGDRVAIVLPNGPEMASAFLAVASYMSAAPLNPAYKQAEYEFYLEDLQIDVDEVEEAIQEEMERKGIKEGFFSPKIIVEYYESED